MDVGGEDAARMRSNEEEDEARSSEGSRAGGEQSEERASSESDQASNLELDKEWKELKDKLRGRRAKFDEETVLIHPSALITVS